MALTSSGSVCTRAPAAGLAVQYKPHSLHLPESKRFMNGRTLCSLIEEPQPHLFKKCAVGSGMVGDGEGGTSAANGWRKRKACAPISKMLAEHSPSSFG